MQWHVTVKWEIAWEVMARHRTVFFNAMRIEKFGGCGAISLADLRQGCWETVLMVWYMYFH